MKIVLAFGGILVVLATIAFFIFSSSKPTTPPEILPTPTTQAQTITEPVEKKAAFAIFTNGNFRIFTAPMYHNLSSDVFIESSNPNIVRVKKENITWDDFFKTLPMKLSRDCLTTGTGQIFCTTSSQTLKFYVNGVLDPSALDRIMHNGDQLLVTFGSETEAQIQKQLQQIPATK